MVSNLLNVFLQLLEGFICFTFYENVTDIQKGKVKRFIVIELSYLVMCVMNLAFDYNVIINTSLLLVFHFILSKLIYSITIKYSLFYAFIIPCLVTITEFSTIELISVIKNVDLEQSLADPYIYIMIIIFSKSLLFFFLKVISNIFCKYSVVRKNNFIFLIYPATLLVVLTSFVTISSRYALNNIDKIVLSISSIALIITVILICLFQQQAAKKEIELEELRSLQQKQDINETYYELLERQNEAMQVLAHDNKNQLNNIYNMIKQGEDACEHIKTLISDIDEANDISYTSNKLLNLIINKYDYRCRKYNMNFEIDVLSDFDSIKESELSSVFDNLLDNAFEAAKASQEKYILLRITKFNNMNIVVIKNSCDKVPSKRGHRLITSKKDGLHGFGYKSACKTVKRNNGDIEWEYSAAGKSFIVSIILNN